jgi:hypothetical protein
MIDEPIPGLVCWSAFHEGIGATVYSSFATGSGTLIDPMVPEDGVEAVGRLGEPRTIVLSNRHHYRHSSRFVERYGCTVVCHEAGLHEFGADKRVGGFAFGAELSKDVRALELDSICPEETTLLISVGAGALSFADGLTRDDDGALSFMPDSLLGEDSEAVKAGLERNLRSMLELDFDALLFAHAPPIAEGGKALLSDFLGAS